MNRPVDSRQREQAIDPSRSFIVQAPAGSGKTELLTQRMLRLLAMVEQPEEVVAITFTRKAAAEMSHRLLTRLRDAADPGDGASLPAHQQISRALASEVLDNDRKREWNLLQQPGRLRIRTIDSLCSELARQLPLLSGLGGGQDLAAHPDALYRTAAVRTLAAVEDADDDLSSDIVRLLDRYDNQYDKLIELLTDMLGHRDQWQGYVIAAQAGDGFDREAMESALRFLVQSELQNALDATPGHLFAELPRYLLYAGANAPDQLAGLERLPGLAEASGGGRLSLGSDPVELPCWAALIRFLMTADGKDFRKAVTKNLGFPAPSGAGAEEKARREEFKAGFLELLESLRGDEALKEAYANVLRLPEPHYDEEAWESLESMLRLLLRCAQEWKIVLAETGMADFSEVSSRAIEALGPEGAPSDLALRMDYRISHLLVDEFQDTSVSQIRLLERLTAGWSPDDGRTMFLVGDPMQSIYRFRKAEVNLFIKAWSGDLFPHISLSPLRLQVNFRSTRPIVDWVNRTFPAIMPEHADPVLGAVPYQPADSRSEAPEHGSVDIQVQPARDDHEEARRVIQAIGRRARGESAAVLVRSRAHAETLLAELDREKVHDPRFRYQAMDFFPLAGTPLIRDLVSLTLAVTQPANRLAWLSLLRAPFIGLALPDLDALAGGRPDQIIADSLEAPSGVSEEGLRRIGRVVPILRHALQVRGRQSVRRTVEEAWLRLGGPACADSRSQLDDADTFFGLVDALEEESLPIDHDTLDLRMKDLYAEPDSEADGTLQVMTIYSAKGLQFDHVIIPGLNLRTGSDKGRLLHWFELAGENRCVMSPMRNQEDKQRNQSQGDLIEYVAGVEKKRRAYEDGRLLYVAATRAVSTLTLLGAVSPNAGGEIKPDALSLMNNLWPAIKAEQEPLIRETAAGITEPADGETGEFGARPAWPQEWRRLPPDWELPDAPDPVPLNPPNEPETHDYIEFSWAGEDARLTGDLVHQLLQQIADRGEGAWRDSGGFDARELWCLQQLSREGVTGEKAVHIVDRARRAVANTLASEKGRWILRPHAEARSEYAVTAVLDGAPRNLVLDRTFVENGVSWIIDYKISSHTGGELYEFLEREKDRYREQLATYRKALEIDRPGPIRTALYFPLLDRFCEVDTGAGSSG